MKLSRSPFFLPSVHHHTVLLVQDLKLTRTARPFSCRILWPYAKRRVVDISDRHRRKVSAWSSCVALDLLRGLYEPFLYCWTSTSIEGGEPQTKESHSETRIERPRKHVVEQVAAVATKPFLERCCRKSLDCWFVFCFVLLALRCNNEIQRIVAFKILARSFVEASFVCFEFFSPLLSLLFLILPSSFARRARAGLALRACSARAVDWHIQFFSWYAPDVHASIIWFEFFLVIASVEFHDEDAIPERQWREILFLRTLSREELAVRHTE